MHSVAWHHVVAVLFGNFWQLLWTLNAFEWWPWPRQHFCHGRHDSWDAWWQLGCSPDSYQLYTLPLQRSWTDSFVRERISETWQTPPGPMWRRPSSYWPWNGMETLHFLGPCPSFPVGNLAQKQYLYSFIGFNRCTIRKGLLPSCAETSGRTLPAFLFTGKIRFFFVSFKF